MSKTRAQRRPAATPDKTASGGRVFKFSFKDIPIVDAAMEARLEAAARIPRKDRHYPVIVDTPSV